MSGTDITDRICAADMTKKDAGYLRQDGKTPWSFTPVWYWDSVLHVQDRWEARR